MTYDYDRLYAETPDALGLPSAEIVAFFSGLKPPARVLDVGCGQGRDALFIARAGHAVVGVDRAPHGIRDLLAAARSERLAIAGMVADITDFVPEGHFDVVLIDRTLHMLAETARLRVLSRLLDHVAPGGRVLIADEKANMPGFRQVLADHRERWETEPTKPGYLFARRRQSASSSSAT